MATAVQRQKNNQKKAKKYDKEKAARKAAEAKAKKAKKKLKKAEKKGQPMARRFVKMIQKAPTLWAFIILILAIAGVVAFYFREHGPAVTALLLIAGIVGAFIVWAFQSAATKKYHK